MARSAEDLLTADDFAREARVSKRTVRRWMESGYCPKPFHLGGSPRWRWGVIWQWLREQESSDDGTVANVDKAGQSRTSGPDGPEATSDPKKRR